MKACPCCSYSLLRHIDHNKVYWYCSHCHQEMPDLDLIDLNRHSYLRSKGFNYRSQHLTFSK